MRVHSKSIRRPCGVSVLAGSNFMPKGARGAGSLLSRGALIALLPALALALPAAAGGQVLDPTLDQYAPSTQQIQDQVKGGGHGHGGGQGSQAGGSQGDGGEVPQGGGAGQVPQGGGAGQVPQGGGAGQVSPASDGGQANEDAEGGQVQGNSGPGAPAHAEGNGLGDRVVGGVPVTGFDLLALILAALAVAGTAVLLRRLSRRPEPGA